MRSDLLNHRPPEPRLIVTVDDLPAWGERLARALLDGVDTRWEHTRGVARRARELAAALPESQRPLLVAAAWLHDIGYCPALVRTGFHPLDGALYLAHAGADATLVALVAHHSGARFAAPDPVVSGRLARLPFTQDRLTDALTAADQTVGPAGEAMTAEQRLAEKSRREGRSSASPVERRLLKAYLLGAVRRAESRLMERRGRQRFDRGVLS